MKSLSLIRQLLSKPERFFIREKIFTTQPRSGFSLPKTYLFVKHINYISINTRGSNEFPFSLSLFKQPFKITFKKPVVIIAGDNGCGKSTLLEAIAHKLNLPTIGSYSTITDETFAPARSLYDFINIQWNNKTHSEMFFRAEDYIGFVRSINTLKNELGNGLKEMAEYLQGYGLRLEHKGL